MKVKLLKKLRKRFVFYYDRDTRCGNPWKIFDKVKDRQVHYFHIGIRYYSEQACFEMMKTLHLLDYWSRIYDRKESRRIAKVNHDQKEAFKRYDKTLK